jgi:hypothetical protein
VTGASGLPSPPRAPARLTQPNLALLAITMSDIEDDPFATNQEEEEEEEPAVAVDDDQDAEDDAPPPRRGRDEDDDDEEDEEEEEEEEDGGAGRAKKRVRTRPHIRRRRRFTLILCSDAARPTQASVASSMWRPRSMRMRRMKMTTMTLAGVSHCRHVRFGLRSYLLRGLHCGPRSGGRG